MRREAQAVILVLLGGVLLRLVLSGEYTNYVKPFLHLPLLVGGILLLLLGLVGFVRDWHSPATLAAERRREAIAKVRTHGPGAARPEATEPEATEVAPPSPEDPDDHDDHSTGHGVGWLWCIPIFVLFLVPPPALGSYAAGRQGAVVAKPPASTRFGALTGTAPIQLEVHDYAERAAWDTGRSLVGQVVTLTGFVTPRSDGGWYLTRMKVSCCAADARPYQVEVLGSTARFSRDAWVRVTGSWEPSREAPASGPPAPAKAFAAIRAARVEPVKTPSQPYE